MSSDIIVRAVEERPFVPFQMHLTDGRILRVPHSDYSTMERYALAVVVYDDDGTKEVVDVALIVSLKFGKTE